MLKTKYFISQKKKTEKINNFNLNIVYKLNKWK